MFATTRTLLLTAALLALGALPASAAADRDLKTDPADFMASGTDHQDRLGRSIAFGDIDNDGFADLASGAPLDEPPGQEPEDNRGALHVYFGKAGFQGTSSSPDLIIWGEEGCEPGTGCNVGNNDDSDVLGKGVAMGDVNKDGKDDLIVSAVRARKEAGVAGGRVGKVYIFFGRASWPSEIDLAADPDQADVTIIGESHQSDLGIHIDTGDFDDDGKRDVIVGAASVLDTVRPGAVWVFYGRKTWPTTINLQVEPNPGATLEVNGAAGSDMLGHAVAAGDLTGDGIADIAAGAPFGTGGCGGAGTSPGQAHLLFGSTSRQTGSVAMADRADVTIESDDDGDELGRRLAIGNVGGSGTGDLILGASCGDAAGKTDNGVGYVLFGKLTAGTKNVDGAADLKVFGENDGDNLGAGTAAGDITGDGRSDLILGADGGDGPDENRTDAGEAAVLIGAVPTGTRNLANGPADLTVYGDDQGDHLGLFVGAGNVNRARGADLGVTAPQGSGLTGPPPEPQAGEVHVITDPCTLTGTAGADVLVGTPGPDVICGLGGDDVLKGKGGNDLLVGGPGDDDLFGGQGPDLLRGGGGSDLLNGGGGGDTLVGQGGDDELVGRGGKDVAKGGPGDDLAKGGAGKDTLVGRGGHDVLRGQKGNDLLKGGGGNDVLNGGPHIDTCKPGPGSDVVKNCEN